MSRYSTGKDSSVRYYSSPDECVYHLHHVLNQLENFALVRLPSFGLSHMLMQTHTHTQ